MTTHISILNEEGQEWPQVREEELAIGRGVKGSPRLVLDTHKALVNPADSSVYSLVTKDYVLVKHEELVQVVEGVMDEFPEYGTREAQVQFGPGGRMRLEYKFPEVNHVVSGVNDTVNPTWTFFNSYDAGWALRGLFGAFRLVCSNGLVIGEKFASYRQEHHQLEEDRGILVETMRVGMEKFSEQAGVWRAWIDQTLTAKEAEHVVRRISWSPGQWNRLLSEPESQTGIMLEQVFGRPERKDGGEVIPAVEPTFPAISKWLLFMVVTQFITHAIESMVKRKRLEQMAARAFYAR